MKPSRMAVCCVALVMAGGCSGDGGNVDDAKQVPRGDALRMVTAYVDQVLALTGGQRDQANLTADTAPCEGRRGELSERVYHAYGSFRAKPVPEDQQLPTLRLLREHWQQQGYTIKRDRVFSEGRRGQLTVENPADAFEISLDSTEPPNAIAVLVSSPCYQDDDAFTPTPPTPATTR